MPSGPRFPIGPDRSVSWKHVCKKEEHMMKAYDERNRAMASMPTRDALSLFMSKFSPPATSGAATEASRSTLQQYQYSPLDGYSRSTKEGAALLHSQVPVSSMRVLPLPPQDGSRPYERPSPDVVRNSHTYKKGGFLATSSEVYGWQQSSNDCKPASWHGRKRYDDEPRKSKGDSAPAAPAWHGRRKWTEAN